MRRPTPLLLALALTLAPLPALAQDAGTTTPGTSTDATTSNTTTTTRRGSDLGWLGLLGLAGLAGLRRRDAPHAGTTAR